MLRGLHIFLIGGILFDPDIDAVPDESTIIQAPPDLRSLLLQSLAIIISYLFCRISNRLGPDVSSL